MNKSISCELTNFIIIERNRFSNKDDNIFAQSFSQLIRYYEFITIIFQRYEKINKDFFDNVISFQATLKPGNNILNEKQIQLQNEGRLISSILHLEIESFYLFSKILLDRIARVIEFYFGKVRNKSLHSHDKLSKNLEYFCLEKKLNLDPKLMQSIKVLKKDVSDYRDHIAHEDSPKTVKMTTFDGKGNTRIAATKICPVFEVRQIESKNPREVLEDIENYLISVIDFISNNKDKTNLELL